MSACLLLASESLLLAFCLPLSAFSLGCERSFYPGFFDENDYPKSNFRKIMHIHVTHAIVDRYPKVKFVWAHVGLSQELATLHPAVHARILEVFFERFSTNLWLDTSWDVLAKQNFVRGYGASNRPRPHRIPEEIGTEIVTEIVLVPPHPPPTPPLRLITTASRSRTFGPLGRPRTSLTTLSSICPSGQARANGSIRSGRRRRT